MPFLNRGMGGLMGGGAVIDWWLAGGIPAANVKEHVENPTQGQAYAGGTLATAWTIAFRTALASVPSDAGQYAFASESGVVVIGENSGPNNGYYAGGWNNCALFATGDHTYMLISDGSSVQAYRDGSAVGSPLASANDIGGTTLWRSNYTAGQYLFVAALRAAFAANIGLDATMRAGLHASMMALA